MSEDETHPAAQDRFCIGLYGKDMDGLNIVSIKVLSWLHDYCMTLLYKYLGMAIVCFCFLSASAYGAKLNDVITSLYLGDGVQLVDRRGEHSHAAHFTDSALHELNELALSAAHISYPYPNASGGTIYNYDPVLEDFVEARSQHGLLYTVQAKTLGQGNMTFGILYSQADYDQLDGSGIDSLMLDLEHIDVGGPGSDVCIGDEAPACYLFEDDLVILDIDLSIKTKQFFIYGAIGLSDNFDIELVLPVIKNSVSIRSNASVQEGETKVFYLDTLHEFEPAINGDTAMSRASDTKTGIGDLKINAKWSFISTDSLNISSFFELTAPTGEYDNFMGQDHYTFKGSFLASNTLEILDMPFKGHVNIGYKLLDGLNNSELSYALALEYDCMVAGKPLTTAVELLSTQSVETQAGFDDNQVDASLGAIWVFRDSQSVNLNYRFPINDDGLRASHIFSAGYAFSF